MVVDFYTYKYHRKQVDPSVVGFAFAQASPKDFGAVMGGMIDQIIRDQIATATTIDEAVELVTKRALELKRQRDKGTK